MKKLQVLAILLATLLLLAACTTSTPEGFPHQCNSANFGMSHITVGGEYATPSTEEIVPEREALIAALREHGYTIEEFDTPLGLDIPAQRVLAIRDDTFIDIVYGLSIAHAIEAVLQYDDHHPIYFWAAQNGHFAYVISHRQVFDDAGFTSMANRGIQYSRCEQCQPLRELWENFNERS